MPPVPVVSVGPDRDAAALGVRLYRVRDGAASPLSSVPAPVVDDLGDGTVAVRQLPAAGVGTEVSWLIYDPAEPEAALYSGLYGPDPLPARALAPQPLAAPQFLVTPPLFVFSATPFTVRAFVAGLEADPSPLSAITLSVWRVGAPAAVIAAATATAIVGSDSRGFKVALRATVGQSDSALLAAGEHFARFEATIGDGSLLVAPPAETLRLSVRSGG